MAKKILVFVLILYSSGVLAQDNIVFDDLRQHNLTHLNSSLVNPTFSMDWNNPRSATLWSRWQWQTPDADPTTLFFNYSQLIGQQFSGGVAFFQNSTSEFQNTGAVLNFAFGIPMGENTNLFFGSNILVYQRGYNEGVTFVGTDNNMITQFSPGVRVQAGGFNFGLTVENALNFNFSENERNENNRIFNSLMSYDFPVGESYLRPQVYVKSIPDEDLQYGLNLLYQSNKYWVQGGYNVFYDFSGGAGIVLFEKLSVGALVEFTTSDPAFETGSTYELLLSYNFGKQKYRGQQQEPKEEPEEKIDREALKREQARRDSINRIKEAQRLAAIQKQRLDSIQKAREAKIQAELEKARQDSIARIEREKEVEILPNEKYEEVTTVDGLEPGFYLIANVFGTERYFENFMLMLNDQGLEPKSFYRSLNGYNYVYLKRYDNIEEARAARNSSFNGRYSGALWIFRVRN